jgi:quinol monooxygenase YgiN
MKTLELARFTVHPSAVDEMLATRTELVAELRAHCRGFRRLSLSRLDESTWLDVVEWDDRQAAEEAAATVMTLPACKRMFSFIDNVVSMEHAEVVDEVEA